MAYFSRGLNRIQSPYNLRDMYPHYVKYIQNTEKYVLSQADFIKVCGDFNKEVVNNILKGKTFYLPVGLGHIDVEKFKSKNPKQQRYIDWEKTVELGKRVWHVNPHSDGYRYRIVWWRLEDQHSRMSRRYNFIASRAFKRTLASLLKNREVDFFQTDFTGKSRVWKDEKLKWKKRNAGK